MEPEIIYLINLEQMCETFSKLPKDILEEDAYFINAFQAIIRGRQKGVESRDGGGSMTSKDIKKLQH